MVNRKPLLPQKICPRYQRPRQVLICQPDDNDIIRFYLLQLADKL
jgi:hypothetical protein